MRAQRPSKDPFRPNNRRGPRSDGPATAVPRRSVGRAFLDTTVINVFYELANLARGQVTARITPKTWWANMEQGWVWDLDDFVVNQIGHPYQGNNYFNAARANGLSFWESAGITAFGSGTWEYFGETNHASLNDLINTTLGGMALGEMFHRAAWLVRDTRATGRGRLMKEIAATVIDPVTGVTRSARVTPRACPRNPPRWCRRALGGLASAGVLWRGSDTRAFDSTGQPFLELDLLYGDPTTGRSRTPYDAFGVVLRFGGGGAFSEAKVRGRLLGQPLQQRSLPGERVAGLRLHQERRVPVRRAVVQRERRATRATLRPRLSLWVSGWGGLTALGAVDSIPLTGIAAREDAGRRVARARACPKARAITTMDRASISGHGRAGARRRAARRRSSTRRHHLYSLDGVRANHFLQQLRLDLLVPLRGPLGLGVAGEYFDRRTYYKDAANETSKFNFPQFRAFLTWRHVVSHRTPDRVVVVRARVPRAGRWRSAQAAAAGQSDAAATVAGCGSCSAAPRPRYAVIARKTASRTAPGTTCTPAVCSAIAGSRVNRQMDAGVEVSWVPATSRAGADIRTTFLLAAAQFRPWQSRGFFLKAGMGMAFVRNFVYDGTARCRRSPRRRWGSATPPAGRSGTTDRVGLQVFGAQHVAALGDFQTGGATVENVDRQLLVGGRRHRHPVGRPRGTRVWLTLVRVGCENETGASNQRANSVPQFEPTPPGSGQSATPRARVTRSPVPGGCHRFTTV